MLIFSRLESTVNYVYLVGFSASPLRECPRLKISVDLLNNQIGEF